MDRGRIFNKFAHLMLGFLTFFLIFCQQTDYDENVHCFIFDLLNANKRSPSLPFELATAVASFFIYKKKIVVAANTFYYMSYKHMLI